jgi:hypothetical protein
MGNPLLKKKRKGGQSVLETAVCAVLMVILLAAITNVWLWGNRRIVQRQQAYNKSRLQAGNSIDDYALQWPLNKLDPKITGGYQVEALGEAAVLRGQRP